MDYPPSFRSSPLSEVSIGIQFDSLERLRIPHYGSLWERLKKDYPTVEHAPTLLNKDSSYNLDSNTGLPLPRVSFINKTETRLIQLKANRINFNWRIRDSGDSYPRYPEIASNFFKNLDALEKFLMDYDIGLIQPKLAELTYIILLNWAKNGILRKTPLRFLKTFNGLSMKFAFSRTTRCKLGSHLSFA